MKAEHKKIAEDAFRFDPRDEVYIVGNRGYMDYGIALKVAGSKERVTKVHRRELADVADKPAKVEKAEKPAKTDKAEKPGTEAQPASPETPEAE